MNLTLEDIETATAVRRWPYRTGRLRMHPGSARDILHGPVGDEHADYAAWVDRVWHAQERLAVSLGKHADNHTCYTCTSADGRAFGVLFSDGHVFVGDTVVDAPWDHG